jgi:hypothetical protein
MVAQSTISRRSFAAAGAWDALSSVAGAQVKAATERPDNPPPHPEPPDQRVGYAVIGIGEVASTQAMPAFAKCKRSKLVALVTGEPNEKGARYAAELGIKRSSVYGYGNLDELKNNAEVQAVYIALPNSMHREFRSGR